jgi:hypothetical protein
MSEVDDGARRALAAELFNRAWELIERTDRTPDDDVELLLSATTSRWLWGQVGTAEQIATGDWQVAHAAALLDLGPVSMLFARRSLAAIEAASAGGWRLASAHEGMARACYAVGDTNGGRHHRRLAVAALAAEPDPDDRRAVADQLASLPDR